jgi:hypothetical protein
MIIDNWFQLIGFFFAGVFWHDIKYFTIDFLFFIGRGFYSALWVLFYGELKIGYTRIDIFKIFHLLLWREIKGRLYSEWWNGSYIKLPKKGDTT